MSLSGFTNDSESYLLGARGGQTMSLDFQPKDAKAVLTMTSGGVTVATVRPGAQWSGKLPSNGDYVIAVASPASKDAVDTDYQLELSIQ